MKIFYKKLTGPVQAHQILIWTRSWKLKLPPKVKSFLWQVCSGSLPTYDRLRVKHIQVLNFCQLCNLEDEYCSHTFMRYLLAKSCWDLFNKSDHHHSGAFLDWLESNFTSLSDSDLCSLISIFGIISCYPLMMLFRVPYLNSYLLEWQFANQCRHQQVYVSAYDEN